MKKYFEALNINKKLTNLEDVEQLIKKHVKEFPFTSIPVLLKKELSLELSQILEKIVKRKEGGYCFEQNKLMYEALSYCGYDVESYFARVLNNRDVIVPLTHRFTVLTFEGSRYLVDVGFGYLSPSKPIKFGDEYTETEQKRAYRIKENEDNTYSLQIVNEDNFYTLYKFDLHPCYEIDFELGHFYSHKHPNAAFVNNLVISSIAKEEVLSIVNNNFRKIYPEYTKEIKIENKKQFEDILLTDFNYPINDEDIKYLYDNFVVTCKENNKE